jgi:ubiquinone/menaquinone biosynthesis C-methylase UbiE
LNHLDHINLLRPAGIAAGGIWADLGAGTGAFTLAVRELLGEQAEIHAVDKDRVSLDTFSQRYLARFGSSDRLHILHTDFSTLLPQLPLLDGVIMANSLHFFKDKARILSGVRNMLKPAGSLLLVEYNVDRGNPWVPYPLSLQTYQGLAPKAGFSEPRLLARHPSSFLREFYSASATRQD